jgi:hypothetical protein
MPVDWPFLFNSDEQAWLISFTTQLRTILPQGTYIITHARAYSVNLQKH